MCCRNSARRQLLDVKGKRNEHDLDCNDSARPYITELGSVGGERLQLINIFFNLTRNVMSACKNSLNRLFYVQ